MCSIGVLKSAENVAVGAPVGVAVGGVGVGVGAAVGAAVGAPWMFDVRFFCETNRQSWMP